MLDVIKADPVLFVVIATTFGLVYFGLALRAALRQRDAEDAELNRICDERLGQKSVKVSLSDL